MFLSSRIILWLMNKDKRLIKKETWMISVPSRNNSNQANKHLNILKTQFKNLSNTQNQLYQRKNKYNQKRVKSQAVIMKNPIMFKV